jgi:uncharacterized protein (DUF427 family)
MKALWNDRVIAESSKTVNIENNEYFPPDSVHKEFLLESLTHSTCPWKGVASYYSIFVDGKENIDAAWFYPDPKPGASEIKNHVAFWKGIKIIK